MLANMSAVHWVEWQAFDELEPFGEERADFRAASIVQAIVNTVQRIITVLATLAGVKNYQPPAPVTLEDSMLSIGDRWREVRPVRQTNEQIESSLNVWFDVVNKRYD